MSRYKFGTSLGKGGFAEVLQAIRLDDGWKCAAKKLLPPRAPDDRKRFQREVRMQAQLRHKNIVPIVASRLSSDRPWYIMPRALQNLEDYLTEHTGEHELWIIHQVAAGIQYAHDNGVIHRDLTPRNILLFRDAQDKLYVAVSDFGLGRFIQRDSPSITQSHVGMGTMGYMAPEQYIDAKHVDERADIYALGRILYLVLTGQPPGPEIEYSKVPKTFRYIIRKCCQTNPDDRYPSAKALVDALSLVTERQELLAKPANLIRKKARALLEQTRPSSRDIEELARDLFENTEDNEVLTTVLPNLPETVLRPLLRDHLSTMLPVLQAYDKAVSYGLPFEYCDVVANFYERLFEWADSLEIRVMVIKRLPDLGCSHNRWHVGRAFGRIVRRIDDPALLLAIKDTLAANPQAATWCAGYLDQGSLPTEIRSVLDQAANVR